MRREDCEDLFQRIPLSQHPQVNLILRGQGMITVDVVVRLEPFYLVLRGREQGSTDEGRAFFVPYEEIAYLRIERVMKLGELKAMFGETGFKEGEALLSDEEKAALAAAEGGEAAEAGAADPKTPAPVPTITGPVDPAAIARQNLLDRIRAARASVAGTTGKMGR